MSAASEIKNIHFVFDQESDPRVVVEMLVGGFKFPCQEHQLRVPIGTRRKQERLPFPI